MRTHPLVSILLTRVLLTLSLTPPAEAQRGTAQGRGRPTERPSPGIFNRQDIEARKNDTSDAGAGGQILLPLSRSTLASLDATAPYQFLRSGVTTSAPIPLGKSAVFQRGRLPGR